MKNISDSFLRGVTTFVNLPHLIAIKDGIVLVMPATLIGSVFLLLATLPIPGYPEFMAGFFGTSWQTKMLYPVGATFDLLGLLATVTVSYRLAMHYKIDALGASLVSLMSFFLFTPYSVTVPELDIIVEAIPQALLGSKGIFVAIVTALFATEVYRFALIKGFTIQMPASVPAGVSRSFTLLIPGFLVILSVWLIRLGIEFMGIHSIHDIVEILVAKPLGNIAGSLGGAVFVTFLSQLLWAFGIHGASIVASVMDPVTLQLLDQNRLAFQAGNELPNIIAGQFFKAYVDIGGSGTTLPFVFAMILFARSQQLKTIAKLSLTPGLFNINEPIIFGIPIVLNPVMLIPFILIPVILTIITYLAMSFGLLPKMVGVNIPWTTPVLISGYLVTGGSFLGPLWQIINMLIATLIWMPFLRIADKMALKDNN